MIMKMKSILLLAAMCCAWVLSGCDKDEKGPEKQSSCGEVCAVNPAISSDYHANIHAGLVGSYNLTYNEIVEGGPFSDGDLVVFTITSDGQLVVTFDGKCVTVDKALVTYQTDAEVRYLDECVFDVVFAVSDNINGEFNEVNILSLQSQFLGQFEGN